MDMPAQPPPPPPPLMVPPGLPQQQYYRINMTALTWGEIWRSAGNPFLFLATAPILAFIRLFRIPMCGPELYPLDISLQDVDPMYLPDRDRVDPLVQSIQQLGFTYFGSFRVVGAPCESFAVALMHGQERAYGLVYHVTAQSKVTVYCDFTTEFADGQDLTTTGHAAAVAVNTRPEKQRQLVRGASPERLWAAHRAMVTEMSLSAGGVSGQVSRERFMEGIRRDWRAFGEFQIQRGLWVPA